MRLRCPHCRDLGTIRTSESMSATVTRHYLICNNFECGHTWRSTSSADLTLSPSATPDPAVVLPMSSHIRRDVLAYQVKSNHLGDHVPRHTPPTSFDLFAAELPRGGLP